MRTYPLIVGVISLVFGAVVLSQWLTRRRPNQAIWAIALLMAAIASFAFVAFLSSGSELQFRIYYSFGGVMMAAYLGMGSLYLALPRRAADLILAAVVIVSAIGVALVLVAPIDSAALRSLQHASGAGTNVLKPGLWLVPLIVLNSFGALAVIGVALYSAYLVIRKQAPRRFAVANITIAIGTAIITEAGTAARLGSPNNFWIVMAAGWVVIFAGFLLTTNLAAFGASSMRDLRVEQGATSA